MALYIIIIIIIIHPSVRKQHQGCGRTNESLLTQGKKNIKILYKRIHTRTNTHKHTHTSPQAAHTQTGRDRAVQLWKDEFTWALNAETRETFIQLYSVF